MQMRFDAPGPVKAALGRIGRAEDVHFAPGGGRLALACADRNRLLILDIEARPADPPAEVVATDYLELTSPSLLYPHGLFWLDEETLVVASRGGTVAIFALPPGRPESRRLELDPARRIDLSDFVLTPGSVSVRQVGLGLFELLVCNNHVDQVIRILLDQRDDYAVIASEVLVDKGLDVPDGVAHSASGRWIAISNHDRHCVLVFRNDKDLGRGSKPQAVLRGVECPHGLRFTAHDRLLVVADAGKPLVHLFRSDDGDWTGERAPDVSLNVFGNRAMSGANQIVGESGPKGVDVSEDGRLMVVCHEGLPIAFFDIGAHLPADAGPAPEAAPPEAEQARAALVRALAAKRFTVQDAVRAISLASQRQHQMILDSRSWRYTAPLRHAARILRLRVPWRRRGGGGTNRP